jgi:molybdate transport system substrate-binding protein
MKKSGIKISLGVTGLMLLITVSQLHAQERNFDPPWNKQPESKVQFTVPGIDNVPDLYGDINDPQMVVFFAGNQFMCVDDLISAFKKKHPEYERIFVETLPPGILAKQIIKGSIVIGNLRINLKPDVYTAGKSRIDQMPEYFEKTELYATNKLALMVYKGNPKKITGLKDLSRKDVRVSMPNPEWEGIGKRIEDAMIKAGGDRLKRSVMESKTKDSTTFLTQIHHRQSPMRILYRQSDVAPVWYSEAYYQKMINHPIDMIEIPAKENINSQYIAGLMKTAPHPKAAQLFMDFLIRPEARSI